MLLTMGTPRCSDAFENRTTAEQEKQKKNTKQLKQK